MLTKKEWVQLAKAYIKDTKFFTKLYDAKIKINKEYGFNIDFIGCDCMESNLTTVAEKLLGEDFIYFYYESDGNFAKYNKGVTREDGSHPNCKSLEDLYDEIYKR